MKIVNLLLISFIVMLFSCEDKKKVNKSKNTIQQNSSIKDTTISNNRNVFTEGVAKDTIKVIDTLNKKEEKTKKDPRLKVVIDGKVYYKKNIKDYQTDGRYDNRFIYFDVKEKREYYIQTGEYNYGSPIWETDLYEVEQ